jgi:hypothetical protein
LHASCQGEPKDLAKPHEGSCNPYAGDTSCRSELAVLCSRAADAGGGLVLATATPVAGFLLTSRDDGDARCVHALGAGWRMASFNANGVRELRAQRLIGAPADTRLRVWVAVGDQRANCWDK